MSEIKISFHPVFIETIKEVIEIEEERLKLQTVVEPGTFERVREIIDTQEARKRAAFYGTVYEAACYGEDFSQVESLKDIADIYARFIVRRNFGE